ncbi:ABC transporter substrate-binding protein [Streptomyces sp. NPDC051576]|uniref:ABC transporter substrate-binding protein n=1 Tax=Streptomyces sp. NPDC051576 TaxID=3155803 RepID=UPI00342AD329
MTHPTPQARAPRMFHLSRGNRVLAVASNVALGAALLGACGGTDSATDGTVTVGVGGNIFDLPIRLAEANGYFAKQGLKVKFVTLTAATDTSALQSGSVQFLNDSPTDFLSAIGKHLPETAISTDGAGNPLGLIVSTKFAEEHHLTADTPAAEVAKALAGSTGGSSSANTKAEAGLFLKEYGVDPDKVKWISLLSASADKAALKSNEIDWFTTSEPTPLEIQDSGDGVVVADATKVPAWSDAKTGYTILVVARNSFLAQHADTAEKFVTAVQQATAYMHAHLDSAEVQSVAQKALPGVPANVIRSSLPLVDWPADGAMRTSGWNTTLAFINSLDTLPATAKVTSDNWTNKYLP